MTLRLVRQTISAPESRRDGFAGRAPLDDNNGWYARLRQEKLDTKLFAAVRGNKVKNAIRQLERGADANARDEHNQTPVMLAAYFGHDLMIDVLRAYGADMNEVDDMGGTALMGAVDQGRHSTAKLLKENGAIVNPRDSETSCTIRIAKSTGDWPMVRLLEGIQ